MARPGPPSPCARNKLSRPSTTGSPPSSRPGKRVDVLRSRSRCLKRAARRRGNLSLRARRQARGSSGPAAERSHRRVSPIPGDAQTGGPRLPSHAAARGSDQAPVTSVLSGSAIGRELPNFESSHPVCRCNCPQMSHRWREASIPKVPDWGRAVTNTEQQYRIPRCPNGLEVQIDAPAC